MRPNLPTDNWRPTLLCCLELMVVHDDDARGATIRVLSASGGAKGHQKEGRREGEESSADRSLTTSAPSHADPPGGGLN